MVCIVGEKTLAGKWFGMQLKGRYKADVSDKRHGEEIIPK